MRAVSSTSAPKSTSCRAPRSSGRSGQCRDVTPSWDRRSRKPASAKGREEIEVPLAEELRELRDRVVALGFGHPRIARWSRTEHGNAGPARLLP